MQINREAVPEAGWTKTTSPTTMVVITAELHGRTAKTASNGIAIRQIPYPQSFLVWKIRFKNQVTNCYDFPSDAILWIKEVEMVDSLDELKSSRSVCGKDFPNFEMLDAKIASALNKIIQNSQFKKEGQHRGAESPKRRPVSTRKTDRLHDLRLLSSDWRSCYSIKLCWFLLCYSSWWQYSGIRCKMGRSSIVFVNNSIRWCLGKSVIRESTQLKTVLELYDMENQQKISVPNFQKLKTMVKRSADQKLRLRNFDAGHGRIESGAVVKSRNGLIGVDGEKGVFYQWKEGRPVFERRPLQFKARDPRSCAKTRTHCRHAFWANRITRSKCVEEEKYPRQK